jgi:hypothetical protein
VGIWGFLSGMGLCEDARAGLEPACAALQAAASPLGHRAWRQRGPAQQPGRRSRRRWRSHELEPDRPPTAISARQSTSGSAVAGWCRVKTSGAWPSRASARVTVDMCELRLPWVKLSREWSSAAWTAAQAEERKRPGGRSRRGVPLALVRDATRVEQPLALLADVVPDRREHRPIHQHRQGHDRPAQTEARRAADHPHHPRNRVPNHDHHAAKDSLTDPLHPALPDLRPAQIPRFARGSRISPSAWIYPCIARQPRISPTIAFACPPSSRAATASARGRRKMRKERESARFDVRAGASIARLARRCQAGLAIQWLCSFRRL